MSNIVKNTKQWKIKSDEGFVPFHGVAFMGTKPIYRVSFEDGTYIDVTDNHRFFTEDERPIMTCELTPGIIILGENNKRVVDVNFLKEDITFDIIESRNHKFFGNGVLNHNCQFLSSDPLLIDTNVLANLTRKIENVKPIGKLGEIVFFKQPQEKNTYLVGIDPATGSGQDFTAIEVFEFPSMEQVAEWRSNVTSSAVTYHILKKLLKSLEKMNCTVYFSIENNGVGEGIIALYEADESPPQADLISESGTSRLGITTTGKSKLKLCINLKEMLERDVLHIKSKILLEELKHFVRRGSSYVAKRGSTDDSITATLIVIRILYEISSFEQEAYDKVYTQAYIFNDENDNFEENYDDTDEPLGFVF